MAWFIPVILAATQDPRKEGIDTTVVEIVSGHLRGRKKAKWGTDHGRTDGRTDGRMRAALFGVAAWAVGAALDTRRTTVCSSFC